MILLPKCLYVTSHIPTVMPKSFFITLDTRFITFILANRRKLKLSVLQRPNVKAGMALSNMYYYYLTGQLCYLFDRLEPVTPNVVESHLAHVLKLNHLLIASEAPLNLLEKRRVPILTLACMVGREAKQLDEFRDTNLAFPLWHNRMFPHLQKFVDYAFWEHRNIVTLETIYSSNDLASFA